MMSVAILSWDPMLLFCDLLISGGRRVGESWPVHGVWWHHQRPGDARQDHHCVEGRVHVHWEGKPWAMAVKHKCWKYSMFYSLSSQHVSLFSTILITVAMVVLIKYYIGKQFLDSFLIIGDFSLPLQARRLEKLGAHGGIVVDNVADTSSDTAAMFAMSGDGTDDINIPMVFLFSKEGKILLDALNVNDHGTVEVLLLEKAKTLSKYLMLPFTSSSSFVWGSYADSPRRFYSWIGTRPSISILGFHPLHFLLLLSYEAAMQILPDATASWLWWGWGLSCLRFQVGGGWGHSWKMCWAVCSLALHIQAADRAQPQWCMFRTYATIFSVWWPIVYLFYVNPPPPKKSPNLNYQGTN